MLRAGQRNLNLGNPFTWLSGTLAKLKVANREESIAAHKVYFVKRYKEDIEFRETVDSLKGLTLACFCAPLDCHCDIIAEYANTPADQKRMNLGDLKNDKS
jgi:hypothetical protein